VESFPITKGWLFVAPIIAGALAVFGDGMNFAFSLIGVASLFLLFVEWFWNFRYVKDRRVWLKILVCAVVFAGFCASFASPLTKLYNKSDEDLRVSFEVFVRPPNTIEVRHIFLNLGKQSALIGSFGLFEVSEEESPHAEVADDLGLCDNVGTKFLQIVQLMGGLGFSISGKSEGKDTTNSLYGPTKLIVDGKDWTVGGPIEVEGGKSRTISSVFSFDQSRVAKFKVTAWCPVIATLNLAGVGDSVICKGMVWKKETTSQATSRSTKRFRILPHPTDAACPSADKF
jgi:hypothetical protein